MKDKWPRATPSTPRNTAFRSDTGCKMEGNHSQSRAAYSPLSCFQAQFSLWNHIFPSCKPSSVCPTVTTPAYKQMQRCHVHHLWFCFRAGLQISWGRCKVQACPIWRKFQTIPFAVGSQGGIALESADKVHRFLPADFFICQCHCTAVQLLIFLSPTNTSLN